MNRTFEVGDLVGADVGDGAVQIRIDSVSEDEATLTATVVALGDFYSANHLRGGHGTGVGFVLGETLTLIRRDTLHGEVWWNIESPKGRPWHTLGISKNGAKYFEHYR